MAGELPSDDEIIAAMRTLARLGTILGDDDPDAWQFMELIGQQLPEDERPGWYNFLWWFDSGF